MSIFLVDLREAIGHGLTVRPIPNMVNHETNELFFDNLEIPAENLIGEEGKGFKYILDGLNAERTLIAAECIGDGYWFIDKVDEVRERARRVRPADRPEPGRAVPDRRGLHRGRGRQPDALQGVRAVRRARSPAAPKPTWPSTSPPRRRGKRPTPACSSTAASASPREYDVERKFRETRLYQVAPISTNLILSYVAEHVLGLAALVLMPRDAPARRHHRRHARARDRGAVLHPPARRPRRARDQGRAARRAATSRAPTTRASTAWRRTSSGPIAPRRA